MINFTFFIFGFITVVSQTMILREMLVVFGGNELSVGLILGEWLLGSTLGSYFGSIFSKKIKTKKYISITLILTGLYLFLFLPILSNLRNVLNLLPGQSIGLSSLIITSLVSVIPLSFLIGTQFSLGAGWAENQSLHPFSWRIYFWEFVGFLAGGIIFTFLLIRFLSSSAILIVFSFLSIIFAFYLLFNKKSVSFLTAAALILIGYLLGPSLKASVDRYTYGKLYSGFRVIEVKNTPYSQLAVLEREGTKYILSDGSVSAVFPIEETEFSEAFSLIPLLYGEKTEKALLFGGGGKYADALSRIKYLKTDYVEADQGFMRLLSRMLPADIRGRNCITLHFDDARNFLKKSDKVYDVFYMGFQFPSTLLLNRFYSQEFFKEVDKHLKGGIAVFELPGSNAYLGEDILAVNSIVINTLRSVFRYVKVLPDDKTIIMASDKPFQKNSGILSDRCKELGSDIKFISKGYINYRTDPLKERRFNDELDKYNFKKVTGLKSHASINSDWMPKAVKDSLIYIYSNAEPWSAKILNAVYNNIFLIWIMIFLWFLSGRIGVLGTSFASGAAGMGLQIISIIALQIIAGNIYSLIGISNAVFMAGLALGALAYSFLGQRIRVKYIEAGFVLWILVWLLLFSLKLIPAILTFVLSLGTAFFVGFEFPALTTSREKYSSDSESKTAGKVYAFDLLGGFLGALCTGAFMLISRGILETVFFIAILKIISASWWARNERKEA